MTTQIHTTRRKLILSIDALVILGSLGVIAFFMYGAQPLVIAPLDDAVTTSTTVLFSFDNADTILIDDNTDFSSPWKITVRNATTISLEPGVYYWKVEGILSSEVRTLTILSVIDLEVRSVNATTYEVVNAGNTALNVAIYDSDELLENLTLEPTQQHDSRGTRFIGRSAA